MPSATRPLMARRVSGPWSRPAVKTRWAPRAWTTATARSSAVTVRWSGSVSVVIGVLFRARLAADLQASEQ